MEKNTMNDFITTYIQGIEFKYNDEKDYEKDGHIYCKTCHKQVDGKPLDLFGKTVMIRMNCKCDEQRIAKAKEQEHRNKVLEIKRRCFIEQSQENYTFENADESTDQELLKKVKRYVEKFQSMRERNLGLLIYGGVGTGKTRFFLKPNLMQMHSSYVVTDPKGTVLIECGKMLEKHDYEIKVLNTINFKKSMHYNPFAYLRSEKDILKLVQTIIANTKGEGEKSGEDFWVKAERLYYTALIGYLYYEAPEEEQNFETLLAFIDASEVREEDENFKNAVDYIFDALEEEKPNHFAVKQYRKYKLAAGVIELRRTLHHNFSERCFA